jgi:hypothetical protein
MPLREVGLIAGEAVPGNLVPGLVIGISGEVAPWVRVYAGHLVRVLMALHLVQEPVDGAGVIAANGTLMERRVHR